MDFAHQRGDYVYKSIYWLKLLTYIFMNNTFPSLSLLLLLSFQLIICPYIYLSIYLFSSLPLCLSLWVFLCASLSTKPLTWKEWSRDNIQDFHDQAGVAGSNLPGMLTFISPCLGLFDFFMFIYRSIFVFFLFIFSFISDYFFVFF